METTGRKNAAGGWVRGEFVRRIAAAGMLWMGFAGLIVGFMIGSLPVFDAWAGSRMSLGLVGGMILTFVALYAFCRRVDATWGRGLRAKRQVGDLLEHALAQGGCAFAHDVKESLGGGGNIDHVVMTPTGIWVVETKSGWLSRRRFRSALRQVAVNVRRVRRHLETSLPVRGALVIAERANDSLEAEYDWNGEPVKAFGAKMFWALLRRERTDGRVVGQSSETTRVERLVWNLGSTRYSEM